MTKVLVRTEAHYLSTGYAVYAKEILSRLHQMGFDVIEYASYGDSRDPRNEAPWKFEGVLPQNDQEKQVYESNGINQFGQYKFEQTLLKHKPDIVFAYSDIWMDSYTLMSPFRRCYSLVWMPTIDSEPQPEEWVSQYELCDAILTYSKWAANHIKTLSNKVKLCGQASPGANFNIFQPLNKQAIRKNLNIPQDAFIIGSAMRNQKRKLIPNLIESFDKLMDLDSTIREKGYLYLHTSWPDMGWNIPDLVKKAKYKNRILFTYFCQTCGHTYCSPFSDALTICKKCGNLSAVLPSSSRGVPVEFLSVVYNLMDLYVQYAHSEGLGIPLVEAAACGIPVMATDYSAMVSTVRDCGGYPINIKMKHLDCEKQTYFAIPDNDDLIDKIRRFYYLPDHEKNRKRKAAFDGARKHYNYDTAAQNLAKVFESLPKGKWDLPADIRPPNPPVPQNLTPSQLVEWAIRTILGRHDLVGTFFFSRILKDLTNQMKMGQFGGPTANEMTAIGHRVNAGPYTVNDMLNELAGMRDNINRWEQLRTQQ